ncbi:hypothetical protein SAMN05216556_11769 [Aequorivita viscosa]|uniref:Uncharacterized protein n=1 Tax=Aequorivita viscosa TaxID=797419 RepID=A0A1M6JJC4_9FLAO|nr:hypothetical protein SAMN05216556_11769 [Aequorivita viscosa]SHJ46725.1 hypothetical protein SAMN04487908_11769 [Aequorivita viscosa]
MGEVEGEVGEDDGVGGNVVAGSGQFLVAVGSGSSLCSVFSVVGVHRDDLDNINIRK